MITHVFLIVNGRTGECRLRKTPAAGPMEFLFRLELDIPESKIPTVTIKIPVAAPPAVLTEVENIPFGIPWAISEGIVQVNGISNDGEVIWDYTNEGILRMLDEIGRKCDPWDFREHMWRAHGLPRIIVDIDRWERLVAQKHEQAEKDEQS